MCDIRPSRRKHEIVRKLFIDDRLSARQIATRLGRSKSWVLNRLRGFGLVTPKKDHGSWLRSAPFGHAIRGGVMVTSRREMRIARLVVHLFERERKPFGEIGPILEEKGVKNRRGNVSWDYVCVRNIYRRWGGKL